MSDVRVGQVWADNDWRCAGRTVRVLSIDAPHATVEVVTNADCAQREIDAQRAAWDVQDRRGKQSRIRLDRFKPTSTGYRLVTDASTSSTTGRP